MNYKIARMSSSPNLHRLIVHIVFLVVAVTLSDFFSQHRFSANVARGELPTSSDPVAFVPSCARASGCSQPLTHGPPFQHGVLIPGIVDWLVDHAHALTPLYGVPPVPTFHYVEVLSVFLLFLTFRYYVSQFFIKDVTSSILCIFLFYSLVSLFILPRIVPLTYAIWFPWDLPSITLFTIGLLLLYRRKLLPYYALFVLASLTKQTAVFLAVIYLFTSLGRNQNRSVALHFGLQIAIWMAIIYGQYQIGHANPFAMDLFGASKLGANLTFVSGISNLPFLFSAFGYLWIPTVMFMSVIRDSFVRKSMFVALPYVLAVVVAGDVSELRIYGELAPVVLIAFFHVLKELSGKAASRNPNET